MCYNQHLKVFFDFFPFQAAIFIIFIAIKSFKSPKRTNNKPLNSVLQVEMLDSS